MGSYATTNDMLVLFRHQLLGQLCSNTPGTPISAGALPTDARLTQMVKAASDEMDWTFRTQARYSSDALDALKASDAQVGNGPNAGLVRMCGNLALGMLYTTAGVGMPTDHAKIVSQSKEELIQLGRGALTLPVDANIAAGLMTISQRQASDSMRLGALSANGMYPPLTNQTANPPNVVSS